MLFCIDASAAAVALRYFNVYGPRQSLSNPYTGVAAIFLSRMKNDEAPMVYEDGLQTRDFVSVHDIVQANLLVLDKASADGEVFNVGTGRGVSILGVARQLARVCGGPLNRRLPIASAKAISVTAWLTSAR
jgi:dTDP-L-rhamnose 4-epimerase